jgi:glycosyltransferase involved in cell wall biosynthesis
MKIHILTNALDYGDAVSTHSILLKKRAHDIGIEAYLYAEFSDDRVRGHVTSLDELAANADAGDVLLHQLFNETTLMPYVKAFPGRRVMMYHNITPPEYFPKGSPVYRSCAGGLRLVQSLTGLYHHAVGMSQFSRQDLERMGYPSTDVFPLFVDIDRLQSILPDASLMNRRWTTGRTFLFVGRVAPNKCIGDLLRFLVAYQRTAAKDRTVSPL